jgi:uncharacterized protein YndB with AHSA1/START domain
MNSSNKMVQVSVLLSTSIEQAWQVFTAPAHITKWNFASEDWICPTASNDLRVGGRFVSRMEAKDGSMGFDFEGIYTEIEIMKKLTYTLLDSRKVQVTFSETSGGVLVDEYFEPENIHPAEFQQAGWQAILIQYKKYAESIF